MNFLRFSIVGAWPLEISSETPRICKAGKSIILILFIESLF